MPGNKVASRWDTYSDLGNKRMLDIPKTWEVHHDYIDEQEMTQERDDKIPNGTKRNSDWGQQGCGDADGQPRYNFPCQEISRYCTAPGMSAAARLRSHP